MNNKRRFGTVSNPSKLRKISLNAFSSVEEDNPDDATVETSSNTLSSVGQAKPVDIPFDRKAIITKTAVWLFANPDQGQALLDRSKSNSLMSFVLDQNGPEGVFYQQELQRLRTEKEVQSICSGITSANEIVAQIQRNIALNSSISYESKAAASADRDVVSNSNCDSNTSNSNSGRQRRNRWGPIPSESDKTPTNTQQSTTNNETVSTTIIDISSIVAKLAQTTGQKDDRMKRLMEEQKELRLMENKIRQSTTTSVGSVSSSIGSIRTVTPSMGLDQEDMELYKERLREYEELAAAYDDTYKDTVEDAEKNRGVIDGGTWEHRVRAKEMLETARKNLELSTAGADRRHLADCIPPAVLEAFLSKNHTKNQSSGSADGVINSSNVGYQLLQKSGWSQGQGLGTDKSGISTPIGISSNGQPKSNVGLGVLSTDEAQENDDAFGMYRKRMQLAYRFRPNPLNNPRRDYY